MGLFDGLRAALRKDSADNAGRAQRRVDSMESGGPAAGLRQVSRVTPSDKDGDETAVAKPKKRSKDFLEMDAAEKKAWLAHPTE
jgi:hypothetical protein